MPYPVFYRIKKRAPLILVAIVAYGTFMYLQVQETAQPGQKPAPVRVAGIASGKGEIAQESVPEVIAVEAAAQRESYASGMLADSPQRPNDPENRMTRMPEGNRTRYPVARLALPVPATAVDVADASSPAGTESVPFYRTSQQYPGNAAASASAVSPGSATERLSSAAGEVDGEAGLPGLTPEEINPFLPDGSVAEDPSVRQAKTECPTFITGPMKTRYSYELLEAMGCETGFDY